MECIYFMSAFKKGKCEHEDKTCEECESCIIVKNKIKEDFDKNWKETVIIPLLEKNLL